eukprot:Partr_v1_DN28391_c0_g1_i1_m78600 putative phosphatase domain containing, paladin 1
MKQGAQQKQKMEKLHRKIKESRQGTVLTASNILKRDHYPATQRPPGSAVPSSSKSASNVSSSSQNDQFPGFPGITGAPNFRFTNHNIYGVSQPTRTGLQTITRLLLTRSKCIYWFNTREEPVIYVHGIPYVLRDLDDPKRNIRTYAGISADRLEQMEHRLKLEILRESSLAGGLVALHDEQSSGELVEQISAVGEDDVKTLKEVMLELGEDLVRYFRVAISPNQRPEDLYLDTFTKIIGGSSQSDALIFNCGVGSARTTFGMVVALLVRQAMLKNPGSESPPASASVAQLLDQQPTPPAVFSKSDLFGDVGSLHDKHGNKTLTLMQVIESGILPSFGSAVQFTWERSHLIQSMMKALNGDYNIISSLLSVLDYRHTKAAVDVAIDKCDAILNLRHAILSYRIKYFCTKDHQYLEKSVAYLERYFFLLCFASFIYSSQTMPGQSSFSAWLGGRLEIVNMLNTLRRAANRLFLFRPIEELSYMKSELDENVVRERDGTVLGSHVILKHDQWFTADDSYLPDIRIEGAKNFRRIALLPLYAVAQPTLDALKQVKGYISKSFPKILWINLREEPLCYIGGRPYVLRDNDVKLRNIKSYSGISGARLDLLESNLRLDIQTESAAYDGKVLVHEEVAGIVKSTWIEANDLKTLREAYDGVGVTYFRVPVTSEAPFEASDCDEIVELVSSNRDCAFVLNCQMGIGRSTAGSVIVALVMRWLGISPHNQPKPAKIIEENSYETIQTLVRTLQDGVKTKHVVDQTIDLCATHINLRECINDYKMKADTAQSKQQTTDYVVKGIGALCRYYSIIAFQAYLESQPPGKPTCTFKDWFASHAELVHMLKDLNPNSIVPLSTESDEILKIISNRRGGVLAQNMILKFDHFPGCQKKGMVSLISGAPNFRGVDVPPGRVYGVAMPTKDAIRDILRQIQAENGSTLIWTSLREEPVVFLRGRPYVLRNISDPLRNLETTGIERSRVERMEVAMKEDILDELTKHNNRIMLHEEEAGSNGFSLMPVWETVDPSEVETPAEIYADMSAEGFAIEYLRLPVTDEQAPLPLVFDTLLQQTSKLSKSVYLIFNCQMGRGRTTTGMVVATILSLGSTIDVNTLPVDTPKESNEKQRFLNGNYKMILQLLRVLEYGKLAKRLCDNAIDECQHIQNIREAIYSYKIKVDSKNPIVRRRTQSETWVGYDEFGNDNESDSMAEVAINYLVRYFYLIAFAGYVLERRNSSQPRVFSEWLSRRREIQHILDEQITLD